jgi:hypothetical protein
MKRETARVSLLVLAFILVALPSPVPASKAALAQGNKKVYMRKIPPPSQSVASTGTGQNNCGRLCRRAYRRCLYWAGSSRGRRRACAARYRNCLKRCG